MNKGIVCNLVKCCVSVEGGWHSGHGVPGTEKQASPFGKCVDKTEAGIA